MNLICKVSAFIFVFCSMSFGITMWQTTHNGTSSGNCQLISNKISVTLHQYYADVVEEAEIAALGSVWSGDSKTLEITGTFTLSKGSAVRSMLLWNGNTILKAKLLLRADADSAYEKVVDRDKVVFVSRDPALIQCTGNNQYQFKIYPVEINQSRKIRILYTVPLDLDNGELRTNILTAFTLGCEQIPSQIPVEIYKSSAVSDSCILQYKNTKKIIQFGATYSILTSDLNNNSPYYSSWFSPLPISITPIVNTWSHSFNTTVDSGDTKGNYTAIFASYPDTLSKLLEKNFFSNKEINTEAKVTVGSKIYLLDMVDNRHFCAVTKSQLPWDSIIDWTCYDNSTGEILVIFKQHITCVTDSSKTSLLPLVWASKYSFSGNGTSLGALYGFVDSKMSLLALEADTLPLSIASEYKLWGVPVLTNSEIVINPLKRPSAPMENIIYTDTKNTFRLLLKTELQVSVVNGILTLQGIEQFRGIFKVMLVDARGRVVQKFNDFSPSAISAHYKLQSGLKGVFFVKVIAGNERLSKKITIN